ncbi:MAG TPA: trypsin-like peptidase domain-containing protein [Pirellulales bacterium]|nr:trypsin-like peptidase domain-containing protein [Pirellulales bacterium]
MNRRSSRLALRPFFALAGWLSLACLASQAAPLAAEEHELRRSALVVAVERARSSIVNIHGEKTVTAENPYAERDAAKSETKRVNGMGTGVIVDERGYIITNFHVVDGVKKITVTTADRETYIAQLVSRDAQTDLAIIKVESREKLPVIDIGTSSDLMPGETVIAVGNAFGYEHTVTRGIVSALHRTVQVSDAQNYEDLIQTDASINPGNSGGPLLNIEGSMIGLNVAVRAGAQGIGFAIPADKVVETAAELLSTRRLEHTWHGMVARPIVDENGVVIETVDAQSPAAESGLKSGDIIHAVARRHVSRALDLERALLGHHPGEKIAVEAERDGQRLQVNLVLASAPDATEGPSDPVWDTIGLEARPITAKQFQHHHRTRYRGGLLVREVRPDSPAARQGIRRGDILVGMHIWETVSLDNLAYILNRSDLASLEPLKFYILRENEPQTLYGFLQLSRP